MTEELKQDKAKPFRDVARTSPVAAYFVLVLAAIGALVIGAVVTASVMEVGYLATGVSLVGVAIFFGVPAIAVYWLRRA